MEKTAMNKMIELLNTLELAKSDKVKYENIRTEISNMFDSIMITYCNHTGIEWVIQKNICDTARIILNFLKIKNFDDNILLDFIDILIDHKIQIKYLNDFIFNVIKDTKIKNAELFINLAIKKLCHIACRCNINESDLIFNKITDIFSKTVKHFKKDTTIIKNVLDSMLDNKSYFKYNKLLNIKYDSICKKSEMLYSETLEIIKLENDKQNDIETKKTIDNDIVISENTSKKTHEEKLQNEEEWISPKKYNKYDKKRKNTKKKYTTVKKKEKEKIVKQTGGTLINRRDGTINQNTIDTTTRNPNSTYNTLIDIQNAITDIDGAMYEKKEEAMECDCCPLL